MTLTLTPDQWLTVLAALRSGTQQYAEAARRETQGMVDARRHKQTEIAGQRQDLADQFLAQADEMNELAETVQHALRQEGIY